MPPLGRVVRREPPRRVQDAHAAPLPRARRLLALENGGPQFRIGFEPDLDRSRLRVLYVGHYLGPADCAGDVRIADCLDHATHPPPESPCVACPQEAGEGGSGDPGPPVGVCADLPCADAAWWPAASTLRESRYVERLVPGFERAVADASFGDAGLPYGAGGDVLPDEAGALQRGLGEFLEKDGEASLHRVNVVVAGSNATDLAFASASVRETLLDWVEAGGTLIVLGAEAPRAWTLGEYGVELLPGGGTPTAADPEDRLLTEPNPLRWARYHAPSHAWRGLDDAGDWRRVVDADDAAVVGLSHPGVHGAGRVVVSAWRPHDAAPDAGNHCDEASAAVDDCPGVPFLENLLLAAYDELAFAYGPDPPGDDQAGTRVRRVGVYYPPLEAWVEGFLSAAVWGSSLPTWPTPTTTACRNDSSFHLDAALSLTTSSPVELSERVNLCDGTLLTFTLEEPYPSTAGHWEVVLGVAGPGAPTSEGTNPCSNRWLQTWDQISVSFDDCWFTADEEGEWSVKATVYTDGSVGDISVKVAIGGTP